MKKTTYIIIGMLLACAIAICSIIICISKCPQEVILEFDGEPKTVQLPECKVVCLQKSDMSDDENNRGYRQSPVIKTPLQITKNDSLQGSLCIASDMEEFISTEVDSDTLRIIFDFPYRNGSMDNSTFDGRIEVRMREMAMNLPQSVVQVTVDNIEWEHVFFKGIRTDTLSLDIRCNQAIVDDCQINSLNINGTYMTLNSGKVANLYADLDNGNFFNINKNSFFVDTAYFTGGNRECYMDVEQNEYRQLLWMPKNEEAFLNLRVQKAAKIDF